jgi:prepilin peptidase CpaA
MEAVIPLLGIAVFALVAYGDLRKRRIPNGLTIAVAALGLVRLIPAGDPHDALYTLAAAVAVFAVTFAMFWFGWIGGGDAKLVAAATLLIGAQLALAVLAATKFDGPLQRLFSVAAPVGTPARSSVPYGVAIAVAGAVVLFLQTSFVK